MKTREKLVGKAWSDSDQKRYMDIALVTGLLPLAVPTGISLLALSRIIDGKGALYAHERIGQSGALVTIRKIRTMHEAGQVGSEDPEARITGFGRKIRPSGLDEIPQLGNILDGSMTVVAPRITQQEGIDAMEAALDKYTFERWQEIYLCGKPGSISTYQIVDRSSHYSEQSLKLRAALDFYDSEHTSFRYDMQLLARAGKVGLQHLVGAGDGMNNVVSLEPRLPQEPEQRAA